MWIITALISIFGFAFTPSRRIGQFVVILVTSSTIAVASFVDTEMLTGGCVYPLAFDAQ
jgi:hypothetical protein